MALVNPCKIVQNPKNTGAECDGAMKAPAMIIMAPVGTTYTDADIAAEGSFTDFVKMKVHADPANRWFIIFNQRVTLSDVTDAKEADVLETLGNGSTEFIRYGMYQRTYMTTKGGICLAQALIALGNNYGFVEVDIKGKVAQMINADKSYSPIPVNLAYGAAPELANFKTAYKNALYMSFSVDNYINKAKIFGSDAAEDLISLRSLYDVQTFQSGAVTNSGATAAAGGYTIVKGSTGDTIDVKVSGVSISGGPVLQSSSESTDTLLAAKVKAAINALTAATGYSANNTAGALTITAPASLGATINTVQATATIVGTITTTTPVAFTSGVTGTMVLKFGIQTECANTDLIALYGATLVAIANLAITKAGVAVVVSGVSIVSGVANATVPYLQGTYIIDMISAAGLRAIGIEGYDVTDPATIVIP